MAFSPDDLWLASCAADSQAVTLHPITVEGGAAAATGQKHLEESRLPERPASPGVKTPQHSRRASVDVAAIGGFQVNVSSGGKPLHARRASLQNGPHPAPRRKSLEIPSLGLAHQMSSAAPASSTASKPSASSARPARRVSLTTPVDTTSLISVGVVEFRPPSNVVDIADEGFHIKVRNVDVGKQKQDFGARVAARRSLAADVLAVNLKVLKPLTLCQSSSRAVVCLEHKDEVVTLAFSPDGCSLVAGGEDRRVVLWNVEERSQVFEAKMRDPVTVVAYSPCGKYITAGDSDSAVSVWDTTTHEEVGFTTVEGDPLAMAMTSRQHNLLAVGTTAKKAILLSVPGLEEIADLRHDGHVHALAFSPDGCTLAGGGGTDDMHGLMTTKKAGYHEMKTVMWQVSAKKEDCKYLGSILFDDIVHATAFSPSGKLLAVGGENRRIELLIVARKFEKACDLPCAAGVRCLAWCPDSRFLAEGGEDMQVSVWDVYSETVVLQLPKVKDWICSLAFSCDQRWLATCGYGTREVTVHPIEVACLDRDESDEDDPPSDSESEGGAPAEGPPQGASEARISVSHV